MQIQFQGINNIISAEKHGDGAYRLARSDWPYRDLLSGRPAVPPSAGRLQKSVIYEIDTLKRWLQGSMLARGHGLRTTSAVMPAWRHLDYCLS